MFIRDDLSEDFAPWYARFADELRLPVFIPKINFNVLSNIDLSGGIDDATRPALNSAAAQMEISGPASTSVSWEVLRRSVKPQMVNVQVGSVVFASLPSSGSFAMEQALADKPIQKSTRSAHLLYTETLTLRR